MNTLSTKLKVLINEDNQFDAELLKREITRSGLDVSFELVQTQGSFEMALEDFKPHLILSDYSLPGFDGLTAFRIKEQKYPDVPFIIVSGTIGEENAVELIKSGITDYVLKDKLYTIIPKINRAIKEAEQTIQKRNTDERLKQQYEKLLEISLFQSHQVRRPLANLLGIVNMFKFNEPNDPINAELLLKAEISLKQLNDLIIEIVGKTEGIKEML